jgi:hypothetical protein
VRENARAASRFLEDHKGLAAAGALTMLLGAEALRRRQNKMYTEPEEEDGPPAPRAPRGPRALQYSNELTVILQTDVPIDGLTPGTVIVDPAGMHFIEKNTTQNAKGASKAIYDFLNIKAFPTKVTDKIKKEGDARRATYTVPGESAQRGVVHVVGPDFTKDKDDTLWHDAVARLGTAYANAINEAEYVHYVEYVTGPLTGTQQFISLVRLPVISGGIFAGKFGYNKFNCVPELTARAISYAMKSDIVTRTPLKHNYWLCTWKGDDIDRFRRALKLASSVKMYEDLHQGHPHNYEHPAVRLVVHQIEYPRGAVGYARDLYKRLKSGENGTKDTKIGLMIAGNNGRPGGSVGKGLESIPIVDNDIVNKGVSGKLNTQEESVVSAWLDAVAGDEHEERSRVFRSTICGMWGQVKRDSPDTIQEVDYMSAEAKDYNRAWVVRDAHLEYGGECTATLVFVAGPNANENAGITAGGSTKMTFSQKAEESYEFFKECVKQSVLAGLLAMREENVTHALVAYVSCGLYAGKHEERIKGEFRGLVEDPVYNMEHNFTEVTIVGIPEDLGMEGPVPRKSWANKKRGILF